MPKRNDKYSGGYADYPWFFKGFLVLGIILIAAVFIYYTQDVIVKVKENSRRMLTTYAKLWQIAASAPTSGAEVDVIFEEIIQKSDFPIVVTSADGEPEAWRGVEVDWRDTTSQSRGKLMKIVKQMDQHREPIAIYFGPEKRIINYLHYGDPRLITQLRLMPVVEVGVLSLFILVAFITFRNIKRAEQRSIWVGMAKETAHQLGTPLTSLLGWLELLKARCDPQTQKLDGASDLGLEEIWERMRIDLLRLGKVANRFGQIGSLPELRPTDINKVISEAVTYFGQRLPHDGARVIIRENLEQLVPAKANAELVSWVVENLLKNSLEALNSQQGVIEVSTRLDNENKFIHIEISDNGRGIPPRQQKKIFKPGYTTKKRGWGLGLSLAKRIVEEYHLGKIALVESVPHQKTTILVSIPIEQADTRV
ncbi:MAG: HAMP domain-containing sensor histidine kinase [Candidatus Zixiibacteriota bacterium]